MVKPQWKQIKNASFDDVCTGDYVELSSMTGSDSGRIPKVCGVVAGIKYTEMKGHDKKVSALRFFGAEDWLDADAPKPLFNPRFLLKLERRIEAKVDNSKG
jgi:hypothetical protein